MFACFLNLIFVKSSPYGRLCAAHLVCKMKKPLPSKDVLLGPLRGQGHNSIIAMYL